MWISNFPKAIVKETALCSLNSLSLLSKIISLYQFISVARSCPTLRDPMDCNMPGLPVHHQFPELTQTHVHRVGDAFQPSHPLLSPSPPAFNLYQHQGKSILCIRWPKYWSFSFSISPSNEYSGLIFFRMDWLNPTSPFHHICECISLYSFHLVCVCLHTSFITVICNIF